MSDREAAKREAQNEVGAECECSVCNLRRAYLEVSAELEQQNKANDLLAQERDAFEKALEAERDAREELQRERAEVVEELEHDEDEYHEKRTLAQTAKTWTDSHFHLIQECNELRSRAESAERRAQEAERELEAIREIAGNRCAIEKVRAQFGPLSLWTQSAFEKKMQEAAARTFEEAARICEDVNANTDMQSVDAHKVTYRCASAIRARAKEFADKAT